MKTYLITVSAVAISDTPPNPREIDICSPDFPTVLETRIVEMVPRESSQLPPVEPEPVVELAPVEPVPRGVRNLSAPMYGSRAQPRKSRTRAGSLLIEKRYQGHGYIKVAQRLGLGVLGDGCVWLTEPERKQVSKHHMKAIGRGS